MEPTDREMLAILALDPDASLLFSTMTHLWYVSARVYISDGAIESGVTEHRETPQAAVAQFFTRLTSLSLDEWVNSTYKGKRREWRWNGTAFAECTRPLVFEREAERALRGTN